MTEVLFYVLDDANPLRRLVLACRLIEKAVNQQQKVFIHCIDSAHQQQFDELLWNFRDSAFIPHSRHDDTEVAQNVNVLIGTEPPDHFHDLIINLGPTVPNFFSRFTRIVEIVNQDPEQRDRGRDNYRHYKKRNYPLTHHNLLAAQVPL